MTQHPEDCRQSAVDELRAMITEHGVAVRKVFAGTGQTRADFAYTVGLSAVGHPEVIVEGLPLEVAHDFLNGVAHEIRQGATFSAGTIRYDLTEEPAPIVVIRVDDTLGLDAISEVYPDLEKMEAVQLVWTDSAGRLPWHPGHANPLDQQRFRGPVPVAALTLPPPAEADGDDPGNELVTSDDAVVAVSPDVLDGAIVTSAWHTDQGLWCFTTDSDQQVTMSRPLLGVDQQYLLGVDPSLSNLADLPAGARATRQAEHRHEWVFWPDGSA